MFEYFNMGIGLVIAVDPADVAHAQQTLEAAGEQVWIIGEVERAGEDAGAGAGTACASRRYIQQHAQIRIDA